MKIPIISLSFKFNKKMYLFSKLEHFNNIAQFRCLLNRRFYQGLRLNTCKNIKRVYVFQSFIYACLCEYAPACN